MHSFEQMMAQGYRCGAPSQEAEDIDAQVVERLQCPRCSGAMHYKGFHKPNEYVALAVCNQCGHTLSF